MKKTLTINLSGIVFNIDEDAYEKLGSYLNTIKKSFSDSDGRDEIMADIEARIAEMLQEKVGTNKQVVTITDIDHVISIMGKPEDFVGENDSEGQAQKSNEQANLDYKSGRHRRIFRDPDERMLGGVCSGVASYFGFDPLWIRLGFAISFFAFGSGLLLYIILWIVIPKAKTTAEKLEMRGEPVNVGNIGKTINEETEHLKKKVNDFKKEFQSKDKQHRVIHAAGKLSSFITQLLWALFKVIGRIAAVFMVIIGTILLVALLAALFGVNSIHIFENGKEISYSIREFGNIIFSSSQLLELAIIGGSLLIGIPIIRLIYGGFKILFNIPHTNKILKYTFNVLWIIGLFVSVYVLIVTLRENSTNAKTSHTYTIKQPQSGILYLKAKVNEKYNCEEDEESEDGFNLNDKKLVIVGNKKWNLITFNEKQIILGPALLNIIPSATDSFELIITTSARGETKKEAVNKSKKINYAFQQTDSIIEFDCVFDIASEDKWRGQDVQLTLKVPKNKMVFLDKSMKHIIYDVKNASNTLDEDMVERKWVMENDELKCIDCKGLDAEANEIGTIPPPQLPDPKTSNSSK